MVKELKVFYNNSLVGKLGITNKGITFFQYDSDWIKEGFSISPFKLPLTNELFTCTNKYSSGLFGVFADSYIDSWGELVIRKYLSNKNIDYNSLNILDKLSLISSFCMGALTYVPSIKIEENNKYNLDSLQNEVNNLMENKEVKDIDKIFSLGGSSGGSRPKILANYKNKKVIIKFRSHLDPINIAELEYKYMLSAKKCGINIPHIELIKGKKNNYFMIERFDRRNNKCVHMISAAGLLECDFNAPCLDYIELIKLTKIITKNNLDVIEMFRRMVFNVVFNNLDDHTKNFAFLYDESIKQYRLSPAYDLTPSNTYFGEHTTSINGKGINITDNDMLEVAKKSSININIAKEIINKVKEAKLELK